MAKNDILGDASGLVDVGGTGKDNYVVTHLKPIAKPDPKSGAAFVAVGSIRQTSMRIHIPHKHYDIIIRGTHNALRLLGYIPTHTITQVLADDWEYILKTPRYAKHPSFINKHIFAEKNEYETMQRALDSETQELAKYTGTAQCTQEDLNMSNNNGPDFGVSDAIVKAPQ